MEIKFLTSNQHKVEEVQGKLEDRFGKRYKLTHVNQAYPELQGDSTREIALQSATTMATTVDPPFILEDSGIFIDALSGFPGPYSSFVFKTIGLQGILDLMQSHSNRSARFISVIVFVDANKDFRVFEGVTEGSISEEIFGSGGFGFDPIFVPNGETGTYAQLSLEQKNNLSHRGKSVQKFLDYLS